MKNRICFIRALLILFTVFSIFNFSMTAFAVSENNIDTHLNGTYTVENMEVNSQSTYSIANLDYHHNNVNSNIMEIVIIALIVSILVTGVIVIIILHRYKTNGMTEPYPYNQKAPLRIIEANDILVDTKVIKTRIDKR